MTARSNGWPEMIDWEDMNRRIHGLRLHLCDVILDLADARSSCKYWLEAQGNSNSLAYQFSMFQRFSPGYYGEMGTMVILQTLSDMFEEVETRQIPLEGMSQLNFLSQVMVPLVGSLLIAEDYGCELDIAEAIRQASSSYGMAMFEFPN
ncbi:hypothetical protein K438DRAFT_553600 [Mycena galopus ATCC 62051]|nr:hypothetical protein K438DRAFT_553600 [Mycena galopus ATCC 62051]